MPRGSLNLNHGLNFKLICLSLLFCCYLICSVGEVHDLAVYPDVLASCRFQNVPCQPRHKAALCVTELHRFIFQIVPVAKILGHEMECETNANKGAHWQTHHYQQAESYRFLWPLIDAELRVREVNNEAGEKTTSTKRRWSRSPCLLAAGCGFAKGRFDARSKDVRSYPLWNNLVSF